MTKPIPPPHIHKHLLRARHALDVHALDALLARPRPPVQQQPLAPPRRKDHLAAGPHAAREGPAGAVVRVRAVGGEARGRGLDGEVDEVVALGEVRRGVLDDGGG